MAALYDTRCLNHRDREAVARCPSCREFYCRECVTEHEGRVVCAKCLAALAAPARAGGLRYSIRRPVYAVIAFLLIWTCFFALGRLLLLLPDEFHEGTVWADAAGMFSPEAEP